MSYRVGVDIGGTFTDFCVFDEENGAVHTLKVLSTPDRPGQEVIDGVRALEDRYGVLPNEISYFTHGTTVGVNSVIQRKGINLCLFTTSEFEDVLEVARLKMPDPYDLLSRRALPLVSRDKVFGIKERVLFDGTIDTPLDEESVREAVAAVQSSDGEGIVVALLHAYRNSSHERRVVEIIRNEAPNLAVTCASDVWPVIREYERTVTAVVAGYVQPRVAHYLTAFQGALASAGVPAEPMLTKSNGGVMTAELGKTQCAQMLLSGTASGVIGAASIARGAESEAAMSLDIGGTSADVAIIRSGAPQYGVGEMIGEFPIHIPTVSVTSIGEGGGSIAWVDAQGVLKVGPESAGSTPGPACYGQGGNRATITDAFVVNGFLGAAALGYSSVDIDADKARDAVNEIAQTLGLSCEDTAEAIIKVAVSGMYLEVSKLVSRHGIDPRDLDLIAFGGAGPMLACFLARELGMQRVIVPPAPGVLSAYGGIIADIRNDFIRTVYADLEKKDAETLKNAALDLRKAGLSWLRDEQGFEGTPILQFSADMRYRGQSYEIDTPLDEKWITDGGLASVNVAFHSEHERLYDYADNSAPLQIINLRLVVSGVPPKPEFAPLEVSAEPPTSVGDALIYCDGKQQKAQLYQRESFLAKQTFTGPAIITQDDATSCILDGSAVRVDQLGNLIVSMEG
ncbi:MAG: Acetophenone carboxylase gamma subunit [Alphaproteobacteria bacterium MarineAlpha4_Bin2]|nr:MAG: Acetophenone carboxylase gamma subunit [Alphaproteobacteria bacterium MarineAlpha4_Bin2]